MADTHVKLHLTVDASLLAPGRNPRVLLRVPRAERVLRHLDYDDAVRARAHPRAHRGRVR